MSAQIQFCRSCHARIYWLRNEKTGKSSPIDAEQTENGNTIINLDAGTCSIPPTAERAAHAGWLHTNHFATCPDAPRWHQYGKGGKP